MQLKKEILLFYFLILASAGIIIAEDQPYLKPGPTPAIKCSSVPKPGKSVSPFNSITEGILRYKA